MSLKGELQGFLKDVGEMGAPARGKAPTLGGERRAAAEGDKRALQALLDRQQGFNSLMLKLALGVILAIFLLALFFALYYRDKPEAIGALFGGNLLSLFGAVTWIRKLWIEKGLVDLARISVETMAPEEAVRFASTIYWRLLSGQASPVAHAAHSPTLPQDP
jgi:hypothetical protein